MLKKLPLRKILTLLPLALLLVVPEPAQVPASGDVNRVPVIEDPAWVQGLLNEREQKDLEFKTSITSPMAGRERLMVPAVARTFILVRGGEVKTSELPAKGAAFALLFRDGQWYWDEGAQGVTCHEGGNGVTILLPRDKAALTAGCVFSIGRITLAAYPGPDSLALIVFDRKRREVLDFEHLLYYAPDPRYALKARLEKFAEPQPLKVITTRKLEKQFYRYARVLFRLDGKEMALTALKTSLEGPNADYLFIPFKDMSNGGETYEVGRFLDVKDPGEGEFVLDFNRCYNPLCNYSPAYNCPLPPLENILDAAIPAGEKTYPH